MSNSELYVFGIFIIVGVAISILFDVFRILRKSFKTADLITSIQDIVYWIIVGLILIYSIFIFNNGEIRAYIFLGILIGAVLYLVFISKFIIDICVKMITKIKIILKKIIDVILTPIEFIIKMLKKLLLKPISFIIINYKRGIKNIFKKKIKKINNAI